MIKIYLIVLINVDEIVFRGVIFNLIDWAGCMCLVLVFC